VPGEDECLRCGASGREPAHPVVERTLYLDDVCEHTQERCEARLRTLFAIHRVPGAVHHAARLIRALADVRTAELLGHAGIVAAVRRLIGCDLDLAERAHADYVAAIEDHARSVRFGRWLRDDPFGDRAERVATALERHARALGAEMDINALDCAAEE
jgi:hypothetical protein